MEYRHISVLLKESVGALGVRDNGIYVDGTLGGGGHSHEILSRSGGARLIGIDRDAEALAAAGERLSEFKNRVELVHGNFSDVLNILRERGIEKIDGAVLDLGVSSYQLDNAERGFSYMHDAPLDMRMNRSDTLTAYDVVNSYTESGLSDIFFRYGEEKWSKRIAAFIVRERMKKPVETTLELSDIIKAAIPSRSRGDGGHPAKRVFQAVRIEVNGELKILAQAVTDFVSVLKSGARFSVITFHSLEDRIVKQTFAGLSSGCVCPKDFPVCVCGRKPEIRLVSRKPYLPSPAETAANPRAKSAKLRVVEKL